MMKKIIFSIVSFGVLLGLSGCDNDDETNVLIYTSREDYAVEYMNKRFAEKFPNYKITVEYMSTGNHAARLLAEGTKTDCDISHNLEYGYLAKLEEKGYLADISAFKTQNYTEDVELSKYYAPETRNGGAIVVNPDKLAEKHLPLPESYQDLLKPEYKGLVSMPSPKASGTGYMFVKSLVNAWGEDKAFAYFDALTPNILQYTSSGSGPVNALLQGEVAVGLGMMAQAVTAVNDGNNLKVYAFKEGHPYSLYGQAIIKGKEEKKAVREVFSFMLNELNYEICEKFFPEKVYRDIDYPMKNYPEVIKYSDMSNNTIEEKEHILGKWKY